MTNYDLMNLLQMFETSLESSLSALQENNIPKAMHRIQEIIKSIERLKKRHAVDKPDTKPENPVRPER